MDGLAAEENLRLASIVEIFSAKPKTKSHVAMIRKAKQLYIRRQKKSMSLSFDDVKEKNTEELEPIDFSTLTQEERASLAQWAADNGFEVQKGQ